MRENTAPIPQLPTDSQAISQLDAHSPERDTTHLLSFNR